MLVSRVLTARVPALVPRACAAACCAVERCLAPLSLRTAGGGPALTIARTSAVTTG
jgi:hypothetical protein